MLERASRKLNCRYQQWKIIIYAINMVKDTKWSTQEPHQMNAQDVARTVRMRADFILKLCEDLKQVKNNRVPDEELWFLIEDTRQIMREDTEDLEKTSM